MPETLEHDLSNVEKTLLITLYIRVMESQRPDALIKDERSVTVFKKISNAGLYDFSRMKSLHLSEENKLVIILRNRQFDRYAQDFLERHPEAVVVHIGCGLDSRFERVDNGQVKWYDLDLPEVIELRRKHFGNDGGRYHLLGCSVLEDAWVEVVETHLLSPSGRPRPFLFLAEGVFMYLTESQVKRLVLSLRDRFPGAELVFDAYSPIHVWRHNLQYAVSKINFPTHWGIWHGQEIENWGKGILLLGEWGYFDDKTARLSRIRWLRWVEAVARTFRIYRFQLGLT